MIPKRFSVDVKGVGLFAFFSYGGRVQLAIEAEMRRIIGGWCDVESTLRAAEALVTLEKTCVEAPAGWDWDLLDMRDEGDRELLLTIFGRMNEERARFRGTGLPGREQAGPAAQPDLGVSVSDEVRPSAD